MEKTGFRLRLGTLVAPLLLIWPCTAKAGMTVYGLSDFARLRLEEISFFILLLFLSSLILQLLWNHAVKGLSFLPKIRYLQALAATIVCGVAMLLILTMISGIREVLTPDAWRRQGTAYRLNSPEQLPVRMRSLKHLRSALMGYANQHAGDFPPHDFAPGISDKLWEAPDKLGTRYLYVGGLNTNGPAQLLAAEPPIFGKTRLVLETSGRIHELANDEVNKRWLTATLK